MRGRAVVAIAIMLALSACTDEDVEPSITQSESEDASDTAAPSEPPEETAEPEPEVAGSVTFVGTDEVSWEETDLTAPPGMVELVISCGDTIAHTIAIEDIRGGAALAGCSGGGDDNDEVVELAAGTYTFFCSIGNHRQQGMEGTLTVG